MTFIDELATNFWPRLTINQRHIVYVIIRYIYSAKTYFDTLCYGINCGCQLVEVSQHTR